MVQDVTVLIVEDEPTVADLFAAFLEPRFETRIATTVAEALDTIDERIDVALLDRRLPDGPGRLVLESIRDRGYDCRVAMVSAVTPDFDILELGFDHYLVKPVTREELYEAVETLLNRATFDAKLREAASLVTKRVVLEAEKSSNELDLSTEYARLESRIDTLESDIDKINHQFTTSDYRAMFRDIGSVS